MIKWINGNKILILKIFLVSMYSFFMILGIAQWNLSFLTIFSLIFWGGMIHHMLVWPTVSLITVHRKNKNLLIEKWERLYVWYKRLDEEIEQQEDGIARSGRKINKKELDDSIIRMLRRLLQIERDSKEQIITEIITDLTGTNPKPEAKTWDEGLTSLPWSSEEQRLMSVMRKERKKE